MQPVLYSLTSFYLFLRDMDIVVCLHKVPGGISYERPASGSQNLLAGLHMQHRGCHLIWSQSGVRVHYSMP